MLSCCTPKAILSLHHLFTLLPSCLFPSADDLMFLLAEEIKVARCNLLKSPCHSQPSSLPSSQGKELSLSLRVCWTPKGPKGPGRPHALSASGWGHCDPLAPSSSQLLSWLQRQHPYLLISFWPAHLSPGPSLTGGSRFYGARSLYNLEDPLKEYKLVEIKGKSRYLFRRGLPT